MGGSGPESNNGAVASLDSQMCDCCFEEEAGSGAKNECIYG